MVELAWLIVTSALGLYIAESRTRRFVVIAALTSVVWALAFIAGAPIMLRVVVLAVVLLAVIRPVVFGVAAVTGDEAKADDLIESLDAATISNTSGRVAFLESLRQIVPADVGRLVACRLKLWAAARRFDPLVVASTTPAEHFEWSAKRFLRDAQWRRVLGWRPKVSAWDEDAALRAFHEDSQNLIPRDVYGEEPPFELGPWVAVVEDLISDLAAAPFRDSVALEARQRLIDAIRATLAIALGDRSDTSKERQAAAAGEMSAAWKRMANRLEQLRSASDIARR